MKISIVEDNAITRATLEDIFYQNGFEILSSFAKAELALEAMKKSAPDLAILDINLAGEKDGIWLAKAIKEQLGFPFVFLTAYGDAHTRREVVATCPSGYIMKPFKQEDVLTTVEIAYKQTTQNQLLHKDEDTNAYLAKDCLFIKDEYRYFKVKLPEICYIKSNNNYVELYEFEKKHTIRGKLKDLAQSLPSNHFIQVHRSYIVNVNHIDSFDTQSLTIGKVDIPISLANRDRLISSFNKL